MATYRQQPGIGCYSAILNTNIHPRREVFFSTPRIKLRTSYASHVHNARLRFACRYHFDRDPGLWSPLHFGFIRAPVISHLDQDGRERGVGRIIRAEWR